MDDDASGPDPIVSGDRLTGTTEPESGEQSNNVVGRPAIERPQTAFHEATETAELETKALNEDEALRDGGSFDGVAPLQDLDAP